MLAERVDPTAVTEQLVVLMPGDVAGVLSVKSGLALMLQLLLVPTLGLQEAGAGAGGLLKNKKPELGKVPGEVALMLPVALQLTGILV